MFVKDVTLEFFSKKNSLCTQYLYVYKPSIFFQFYDIENLMKIFQKLAKQGEKSIVRTQMVKL
jgi:hypothetical protein